MDVLRSKRYQQYSYLNRYTNIPMYYHTIDQKEICGIGSNLSKDTPYLTHEIQPTDTLDKLSLNYYGNPTYWWVIAYFNDIQDAFIRLQDFYRTIKIPTITSIKFGANR